MCLLFCIILCVLRMSHATHTVHMHIHISDTAMLCDAEVGIHTVQHMTLYFKINTNNPCYEHIIWLYSSPPHVEHVNCNNMASAHGQFCLSYIFGCSAFRLSWIKARPVLKKRLLFINKRLLNVLLHTSFASNISLLREILAKIKEW